MTGYTVDFDIYLGKAESYSSKGLSFDVVMKLIQPFTFHGDEVYFDNFYTSPALLEELLKHELVATGTVNFTRRGVTGEVFDIKRVCWKASREVRAIIIMLIIQE